MCLWGNELLLLLAATIGAHAARPLVKLRHLAVDPAVPAAPFLRQAACWGRGGVGRARAGIDYYLMAELRMISCARGGGGGGEL